MSRHRGEQIPPEPGRGPRGWWRRRRRGTRIAMLTGLGAVVLLVVGGAGAAYALVQIPPPGQVAMPQASTIRYADGSLLATTGAVDRRNVPLSAVPVPVREAVMAAEDRNFYHEPGVSITGIIRAAWADITGGGISQGGSTITQQYAKNAYLTSQRTVTRKLKEIVLAVKLSQHYSKNQILDSYLNTIYLGRGAYGIEAAARRYFGKPVNKLTVDQGMVLAGLIRAPSILDPRVDHAAAVTRFHEVAAAMVRQHWLTPAQGAAATLPPTIPLAATAAPTADGPTSYIEQRVHDELRADGMTDSQIALGGLTVTTTLDPAIQRAALTSVRTAPGGTLQNAPAGVHEGLVAIAPGTGAVRAWYGGATAGQGDAVDYFDAPPGSTFKAIVLSAALAKGIPLNKTYFGGSPQSFPPNPTLIHNFKDEQYGNVDLTTAMADSINTVYVHLGLDAGLSRVAALAHRMGILASRSIPLQEDMALGQDPFVTPLEMASVYATLASGGISAQPYLVAKVTDRSGHVLLTHTPRTARVLSRAVAAEVTSALEQVLVSGTGAGLALPGRPAAGKTGTAQNNEAAWFDGFTPQLATAVDLFRQVRVAGQITYPPLQNFGGYAGQLVGADIPAHLWYAFMVAALAGAPVVPFPAPPAPLPPTAGPVAVPTLTASAVPSTASPYSSVPSSTAVPPTAVPSALSPSPSGSASPSPSLSSPPLGSASPSPSLSSPPLGSASPSPGPSSPPPSTAAAAPAPSPTG